MWHDATCVIVVFTDAQNQTRVREDMMKHLGPYWSRLDEDGIRHMAAYAIAGAGIGDMEKILQKFTAANRMRLNRLFRKWLGKRSYEVFYKTLFETYGYRCDEVRGKHNIRLTRFRFR